MKPELAQFFSSVEAFFDGREDGVAGAVPSERMALYARFVAAHPRVMLEKNFPLVRGVVGEEVWKELSSEFCRRHPPRSHEINEAAQDFAAFLAEEGPAHGMPLFVPALARFEWADFRVYAADVQVPAEVDAPTPNPTLEVLQHPFRLAAWVQKKAPRPAIPEAGEETVLLWRHPVTHRVRFRAADAPTLLALKLAVEGIAAADAAREAGMSEEALGALLRRQAEEGLLLLPRAGNPPSP